MYTTITIAGVEFELPIGDETARLVAADALQEAGADEAAAAMRVGLPVVPLLDGRYAVLDATALEAQLRRLGVNMHVDVNFDDHLPAGMVRVLTDEYGWPAAFAAALAKLPDDASWPEVLWEITGLLKRPAGAGDAVREFYRDAASDGWIKAERLEEGTPDDNPWTLFTIASNAGVRYLAGPHGESYCAIRDWYDNMGDLAETRDEALAGWEGGAE